MNKTARIVFIVAIVLVVFFTSGMNILKNVLTDNSQTQHIISVPDSGITEIQLTQDQIIASIISSNQTETTQEQLQQAVLSDTEIISIMPASLEIQPVLEKVDENGVIRDRINLDKINPLNYITSQNENIDLQNYKIRIALNLKSDHSFQKIIMNGNIITTINDQTLTVTEFSIDGTTDEQSEIIAKFGTLDYFELPYGTMIPKFTNGLNTVKIKIDSLKGFLGNSAFDVSDIMLFKTDLDYSQFKIISTDESGNIVKIYPKDSSLTLGSSIGISYSTRCQYTYRGTNICAQWGGSYDNGGRYPAPILTNIKVFDSNNNLVLDRSDLTGSSITVPLYRNEQYHVVIPSQNLDYMIKTPEDSSVTYDYQCVGTSNGASCGHP